MKMTFKFLFLVTTMALAKAELFTNVAEMASVFTLEQELVKILVDFKDQIETNLKMIKDFSDNVKEVYEKEDCWPYEDKCNDDAFTSKILSNPIYNYQVLKRLAIDFKNVEGSLKKIDTKKILQTLKKTKMKHGKVVPSEKDLHGAAKALNRLQDIYKLDLNDFSKGQILGLESTAELSAKDTFFLGRFAALNNNPQVALKWLEQASLQVALESSNNQTDIRGSVSEKQISQVMKQVRRKLPAGFEMSQLAQEEMEDDEEMEYRLGRVPPKTKDPKKYQTEDDGINYRALCRGRDILPSHERVTLKCFLSNHNQAYFNLSPLKVEIEHRDPHEVVTFHHILSDQEVDDLIALAKPQMALSSIGQDKVLSEIRVSRNTWLKDGIPLVDRLSKRFNLITGLQTAQCFDKFKEGKQEEYEMLQVASYGIGGHYDLHQDPMYLYREPDYLARLGNAADGHDYITGDRMVTFMLYLSNVARGGLTAFPRLGIAVKPEKGSAVMWSNLKRSGRSDMLMLHGGCPVLMGTKWVANKWIRESANIFTRPCIDNIDV